MAAGASAGLAAQQRALRLAGAFLPAPRRGWLLAAIITDFQAFAWSSSARRATMPGSLMETQYQIKPGTAQSVCSRH